MNAEDEPLFTDADVEIWGDRFDDDVPTVPLPAAPPTLRCFYDFHERDRNHDDAE